MNSECGEKNPCLLPQDGGLGGGMAVSGTGYMFHPKYGCNMFQSWTLSFKTIPTKILWFQVSQEIYLGRTVGGTCNVLISAASVLSFSWYSFKTLKKRLGKGEAAQVAYQMIFCAHVLTSCMLTGRESRVTERWAYQYAASFFTFIKCFIRDVIQPRHYKWSDKWYKRWFHMQSCIPYG